MIDRSVLVAVRPAAKLPLRARARLAAILLALALSACAKHHSPTAPAPAAQVVRGSVQFARGAVGATPARDFFVSLWRKIIPAPPAGDSLHDDYTFTDSLGRFEFRGVPPGSYSVYTSYFSWETNRDSLVAASNVEVTARGVTPPDVALTLVPSGVFTGFVKRSGTLEPVEAFVLVDGALVLSPSNSFGAYLLDGIPPGSWNVLAVEPDSLAPTRGTVAGVMPAAGDSVALPDILVQPYPPGRVLDQVRRVLGTERALARRVRLPAGGARRGAPEPGSAPRPTRRLPR